MRLSLLKVRMHIIATVFSGQVVERLFKMCHQSNVNIHNHSYTHINNPRVTLSLLTGAPEGHFRKQRGRTAWFSNSVNKHNYQTRGASAKTLTIQHVFFFCMFTMYLCENTC